MSAGSYVPTRMPGAFTSAASVVLAAAFLLAPPPLGRGTTRAGL